jgi:tRNA (cytidine/uridine-2'-O-)-methyltransferase
MLNIVLYEPEIPPNTGNIMRLCANTGCSLHLVEPLGFDLDEKKLRRAGLDYREFAEVRTYPRLEHYREAHPHSRLLAMSTKGSTRYDRIDYRTGDSLLFGPETRGLPTKILHSLGPHQTVRIPMRGDSRSLNLSNAVAILVYEGLRQLHFNGLE